MLELVAEAADGLAIALYGVLATALTGASALLELHGLSSFQGGHLLVAVWMVYMGLIAAGVAGLLGRRAYGEYRGQPA